MTKHYEAIMVEKKVREQFVKLRDKLNLTSTELLRRLMEKKITK